ncbi:hypothetical protein [Longimicrobium terrae]|uniref:Putative nicotinamide N-methyase n=1 Tax=Longimicrobium terrae TaxID=1639882 RepID=A0A841H583_9BACT|nr:hypothetical protein [Longimicrobium terrae]MBB4639211.1 putative nicotinamide N-methyase [Longimicrobium terrae]MBB6073385.1 putative nicotinamide N-methyase [Longimicrobium terrae]NNC32627.1 hypothetical protein [Longimicrobium terrae]
MTRAPERALRAGMAVLALAAGTALSAQQPAPAGAAPAVAPAAAPGAPAAAALPEADVYRREVFRYQAGGRPDPFQPLLSSDDMGVRAQDLRLVSIVFSGNARQSMATFALPDSTTRVRLRLGQRLGSVTVVAITPRRVDLREDEMGVSRVYSYEVQRAPRATSAPPAAAPAIVPAAPPAASAPATGRRP